MNAHFDDRTRAPTPAPFIVDSRCAIYPVIITPIKSRPQIGARIPLGREGKKVVVGTVAWQKGLITCDLGDDEDKYPSVIAGSKLVEFSISWYHRD